MKRSWRPLILAAVGAAVLSTSGCISIIEDMLDDNARADCDQEARSSARRACNDRVDEIRRQNGD